jgi:hypothetical protein
VTAGYVISGRAGQTPHAHPHLAGPGLVPRRVCAHHQPGDTLEHHRTHAAVFILPIP